MKKFKENLQCAIVAFIGVIPMWISLYGLLTNNMNVAFRSLLITPFWVFLVIWLADKIEDKLSK